MAREEDTDVVDRTVVNVAALKVTPDGISHSVVVEAPVDML